MESTIADIEGAERFDPDSRLARYLLRGPLGPPQRERIARLADEAADESTTHAREGDIRRSIWNSDAHLHFFAMNLSLVNLYTTNLANFIPLHPAALHETNLQRFLCSSSGEEETGSALALSVNVALCLGKHLFSKIIPIDRNTLLI